VYEVGYRCNATHVVVACPLNVVRPTMAAFGTRHLYLRGMKNPDWILKHHLATY
jgi:hypothetical protein